MEQTVAVVEDGIPAEVYLERPGRRSIAGNVYKGVVDNVLPGMEASFVDIGIGRNGFLYVDEIVVPELEGKRHGRRIQELVQRGQEVLVQAVKDPMGTKGARLTTEISLPGRFLVYTPFGEGIGISRRLEDAERERLKAISKQLDLPEGGIIIRTAAEGATKEELEGDLALLAKLWSTLKGRAARTEGPALVYQEAELPLRIVRDLFIRDFERVVVDHERTYRRIVGYLKRTSRDLADRVELYDGKEPLLEKCGVEEAVKSTLRRRVDLPSGGYLIFDYAEAFTVVDVNTGRFVGARGKSSGARLEDTITKNNLEAVSEVVRQLRLRDIGGIIVIDFIDMANPKNRAQVEDALKNELEKDRTKTYVVEISPLGLVEMTRQNVTDGPREILTHKCPTCTGDGIVVSEETYAVDAERRIRRLVARVAPPGVRDRASLARRRDPDRPGRLAPRRARGGDRPAPLLRDARRPARIPFRRARPRPGLEARGQGASGHEGPGARREARGRPSLLGRGRDRPRERLRDRRRGREGPDRQDGQGEDRARHAHGRVRDARGRRRRRRGADRGRHRARPRGRRRRDDAEAKPWIARRPRPRQEAARPKALRRRPRPRPRSPSRSRPAPPSRRRSPRSPRRPR